LTFLYLFLKQVYAMGFIPYYAMSCNKSTGLVCSITPYIVVVSDVIQQVDV
jgi:hypothetical protein